MEKLTQAQIDSLIIAFRSNTYNTWNAQEKVLDYDMIGNFSAVYAVDNYDLFYCYYPLETLSSSANVLRRYDYGDTYSFRKYNHFMVVENYAAKGMNMVSVVGCEFGTGIYN